MLITDVYHAHLQLPVIVIGVLAKMIYDVSHVRLTPLKTSKFNVVDRLVQGPGRAYRGTNVGLLLVHGAVLTRCPSCCHQCLVWEPV